MMASLTEPPHGVRQSDCKHEDFRAADVFANLDATFVVLETIDERIADARLHLFGDLVGQFAV